MASPTLPHWQQEALAIGPFITCGLIIVQILLMFRVFSDWRIIYKTMAGRINSLVLRVETLEEIIYGVQSNSTTEEQSGS